MEKVRKIVTLQTLVLIFIFFNTKGFSEITANEVYLLSSIYAGKDFTNITPYPINSNDEFEVYPGFFYKSFDPLWLIGGIFETNWSDLERGVYLSDSLPYVTGFMGGYDAGSMRIVSAMYFFDPYLTEDELARQKATSFDGNFDPNFDTNSDRAGLEDFGYSDPSKTLFIHRLEFNLFDRVRLSLNELNLIGGKYPDLSDANPFGIAHNNLGEGFSNNMLGVDASIIPTNGWQIYGQFAMDDFVVPDTEGGATDYKPTAFAWGVGTRLVGKTSQYYISPKIEYYKIYTWMYNQWAPYLKYTAKYDEEDIPIGFDYGNDMEGYLIGLDIANETIRYKITFEHYLKGEINLETPYDDERKEDVEGWPGPYGETTPFIKISFSIEVGF
ncbi:MULTISPECIES: hypothetical protein [unclassified Petrotoga]|uniref:hypothetical protein n=1 Tax=unclassified Petrotoga TaxID=2620614 RepID=UPI000F4D73E8|nr:MULTISPECIES: hypothetical protein [unclassified Petrotoga]